MTVTSISEEGWSFEQDVPKFKAKRSPIPYEAMPWLNDPEMMAKYEDPYIYDMEVALRNWIKEMSQIKKWKNDVRSRRYTFGMLWKLVYGEEYDQKKHAKHIRRGINLFSHYSSRVQKAGTFNGKTKFKTTYVIAPARADCRPYGLKLRVEWLIENGYKLRADNMRDPDRLMPGHARCPKTERNMERRREVGRELYRERFNTPEYRAKLAARKAERQRGELRSDADDNVSGAYSERSDSDEGQGAES